MPAFEVAAEDLEVYVRARGTMERAGIPYMVGGGYGVACYAHRRPTKDIDFLLLPTDADRAVEALESEGFFIRRSDRRWLYQAQCAGIMVDLVFGSATHRGIVPVTREWLGYARPMAIGGETFPVAAPEGLIGQKILAQHENRPDWWDAEVILAGRRDQIDWNRILERSAIDPVKRLAFLLFLEARHSGDGWYPRDAFERTWREAAALLGI
jgi:hypothetical protein